MGSNLCWPLTSYSRQSGARLHHAGLRPRALPVKVAREFVVVGLRLPIIATPIKRSQERLQPFWAIPLADPSKQTEELVSGCSHDGPSP